MNASFRPLTASCDIAITTLFADSSPTLCLGYCFLFWMAVAIRCTASRSPVRSSRDGWEGTVISLAPHGRETKGRGYELGLCPLRLSSLVCRRTWSYTRASRSPQRAQVPRSKQRPTNQRGAHVMVALSACVDHMAYDGFRFQRGHSLLLSSAP